MIAVKCAEHGGRECRRLPAIEVDCIRLPCEPTKACPMLERSAQREHDVSKSRAPADFQEHLANLEAASLLVRVDREVNKDTELHPLVRWQFQGGLDEDQRRAFLFTNVVGADGRRFDMP